MGHIDRVLQEFHELNIRVGKLKGFVHGDKIKELDQIEQHLLRQQLDIMKAYSAVLDERIKRGEG